MHLKTVLLSVSEIIPRLLPWEKNRIYLKRKKDRIHMLLKH